MSAHFWLSRKAVPMTLADVAQLAGVSTMTVSRALRGERAVDKELVARVQQGMASRSFTMGPLSDKEVCLQSFCRQVRNIIPEARLEQRPAPGWSNT